MFRNRKGKRTGTCCQCREIKARTRYVKRAILGRDGKHSVKIITPTPWENIHFDGFNPRDPQVTIDWAVGL
jgi:hypothetical protein